MKKVLTIDDSKVVRSMVARHLQFWRCEVIEAKNGREGVEMARQHLPDLVLLDVTMPVMDGRSALAALRADPATQALPVIMLTAESRRELVVEIVKLGVTGCIVKPFQKDSFDREVAKVLGAPAATPLAPPAPLDRRTVLVVDANDAVLASVRQALAATMRVLAASRADAVERWNAARPGIVLVDVGMADAGETLATLRALGTSGLVGIARRGDGRARDTARTAGCHAVVAVPCEPQELLDQVLVAAAAVGSVEEQVQAVLAEQDGYAVLNMPDPRSKVFGKMLPALTKRLRALAAAGGTRLVVDMENVVDSNADVVKSVVAVVSEATAAGLRTAIAASSASLVESLKQIAETHNRLFPSRAAAREGLE